MRRIVGLARGAPGGLVAIGGSALLLLLLSLSPLAAQASDGLVFHAAADAVLLQLTGRLQYDSRLFLDEGTGTTDALLLRRAAPGVRLTLLRDYELRLTADLSTGEVLPLEASASARLSPAVQLRAGKVLVPLGLAQLQGISNGSLAEHGLGSALAPVRDVGVELRGTVARVADYDVGLFNGVPDGVNGEVAWSGDKDVVVRAFLRPFGARPGHPLERLGFGAGASFGEHRGSRDDPFLPAYRTGGRERFFGFRGGDDPVVADGARRRYSPQGYLYAGPFGLLAEYLHSTGEVRLGGDAARLSAHAWQAIGSWVVTGENAAYTGVVPATRFRPGTGSIGAVEVALRVDGLQGDPDAFPRFADPARSALSAHSVTGGVNWYPNRHVRFLVNYQLTRFGAASGGVPRRAEQALVSRVQLGL